MRVWVTRIAAGIALAGLAACAFVKHVPVSIEMEPQFIGAPVAASSAAAHHIVVVRFPYTLDKATAAELRRRYNDGAYYARPKHPRAREPDATTLDEALAKTSYYAFKLQEATLARLPEATIVLQPTVLIVDETGRVRQRAADAVPAASVVVDFFAYIWPQWQFDLVQPLATYGRTLVPIIAVRVLPVVSSATGGAVAGMRYLAGTAEPGDGPAAFSGVGATIVELLNCPVSDAFLYQNTRLRKSAFLKQRPWRPDAYIAWPTYQLTFAREQAATPNELSTETAIDGLARVVGDAIAAAEALPAARRELAAGFAQPYDTAAAAALRHGAPLDETRRELLGEFARAEREFLALQSRELQSRMQAGSWTATFREARDQEQKEIDKAKAIGWIGTIAAGLVPVPAPGVGSYMLISAAYQAWSTVLVTELMNVSNERLSITVAEGGDEPVVTAATLEELRARLKETYARRIGQN